MNRSFVALACSLAACCLLAAGCEGGPALGTVTGQVTMDGEPLADAMVTFVPEEGGVASTGLTDENGEYQLTYLERRGAVLGRHTVRVTSTQAQAGAATGEIRSDSPEYLEMMAGGGDYAAQSLSVQETIPARYNTDSELVREVTSGRNVIDLELTSD